MKVYELLKTLKFKQLISLTKLFLFNPLMIYPTIKATINTIKITEKLYPGIHHANNSANAFRHALWNIFLVKEMMSWNKSLIKSMQWAKKISDWHEDFSPNLPLAREMDLHNNEVGRTIFKSLSSSENISEKILISKLQDMVKQSKKITSLEELKKLKSNLVYLVD